MMDDAHRLAVNRPRRPRRCKLHVRCQSVTQCIRQIVDERVLPKWYSPRRIGRGSNGYHLSAKDYDAAAGFATRTISMAASRSSVTCSMTSCEKRCRSVRRVGQDTRSGDHGCRVPLPRASIRAEARCQSPRLSAPKRSIKAVELHADRRIHRRARARHPALPIRDHCRRRSVLSPHIARFAALCGQFRRHWGGFRLKTGGAHCRGIKSAGQRSRRSPSHLLRRMVY